MPMVSAQNLPVADNGTVQILYSSHILGEQINKQFINY